MATIIAPAMVTTSHCRWLHAIGIAEIQVCVFFLKIPFIFLASSSLFFRGKIKENRKKEWRKLISHLDGRERIGSNKRPQRPISMSCKRNDEPAFIDAVRSRNGTLSVCRSHAVEPLLNHFKLWTLRIQTRNRAPVDVADTVAWLNGRWFTFGSRQLFIIIIITCWLEVLWNHFVENGSGECSVHEGLRGSARKHALAAFLRYDFPLAGNFTANSSRNDNTKNVAQFWLTFSRDTSTGGWVDDRWFCERRKRNEISISKHSQ